MAFEMYNNCFHLVDAFCAIFLPWPKPWPYALTASLASLLVILFVSDNWLWIRPPKWPKVCRVDMRHWTLYITVRSAPGDIPFRWRAIIRQCVADRQTDGRAVIIVNTLKRPAPRRLFKPKFHLARHVTSRHETTRHVRRVESVDPW